MREIVYIEHPSAYRYIIKLLFSSISKPLNLNKIKNLIEDLDLKNKVEFDNCMEENLSSQTPAEDSLAPTLQLKPLAYQKFDPNYPFTQKIDDFSQNSLLFLENRNLSSQLDRFRTFPCPSPHILNQNSHQQYSLNNFPHKSEYQQQAQITKTRPTQPVNTQLYFDNIKFYKQKINYLENHLQLSQNQHRPTNFKQGYHSSQNRIHYSDNNFSRINPPSSTNSQRSYKAPNMMQFNQYMSNYAPF